MQYAGNLVSVFFSPTPVVDFTGAQAAETFRYQAFFHAMLDAGVYLPPSAFEAWFVNAAMDETALGRIAEALPRRRARGGRGAAGRLAPPTRSRRPGRG